MGGNCITCCITQSCWWNLSTDPRFPSRCLSWLVHWEREASGILDGSPITCPTEYEKAKSLHFRKCLNTCFTLSVLGQDGAGLHITALFLTGSMSGLSVSSGCSSCSFAAPGTSAQPWALPQPCVEEMGTLLQQQRALPESITGHCSRECLASVKPCQGGYKAFLKSSESISTFCPPATSNSSSSCFQANSKANEALVLGLGGAANDIHLLQFRSAGREVMELSGVQAWKHWMFMGVPCLFPNSLPACTGGFMRRG